MKLVEINWNPSSNQLRQFGVLFAFVLPLFGWFWSVGEKGTAILLVIGVTMAALAWIWPAAVKWIFLGLSLVAAPFGMIMGEVAMLLIFLIVFLPISLVFRLMGRDVLQRKIDKSSSTYWQSKLDSDKKDSYYRRF